MSGLLEKQENQPPNREIHGGEVRCCDYRKLLKSIPDGEASLVLTDPPFGVNYVNNHTKEKFKVIVNDDSTFSYTTLAKQAFRVLCDGGAFYAFTSYKTYPEHYREIETAGFNMKVPLLVQKGVKQTIGDLEGSFGESCDWIIVATKKRFKMRQTQLLKNKTRPGYSSRLPNCWFGPEFPHGTSDPSYKNTHGLNHPTVKSAEVMRWIILLSTDNGDLVVDPFSGSGATALACSRTGRRFLVGDINPDFCELTRERLLKRK